MKTSRIISTACFLAGIIFLSACEKSGPGYGGKAIQFSSSAQPAPSTKSVYSGKGTFSEGFLTWERIEWESDDHIRVASNYAYLQDPGNGGLQTGVHYADYALGEIDNTSDVTKSKAIMKPYIVNTDGTGSNGLIWDDAHATGYSFYAVYPCPFEKNYISLGSGDGSTTLGEVTATLPSTQTLAASTTPRYVSSTGAVADASGKLFTAAQTNGYTYTVYEPDMDYAFMTAATTGVKANTDGVTLSFKPAYTAFEINLTSGDEEFIVNKVELVGATDKLAGTFTMMAGADLSADTAVSLGAGSTTVSATLPTSTTANVKANEGVTVTFFTVPKKNAALLSLKVYTSVGTATLPLKSGNDAYSFLAGHKYRINLLKVGGRWEFKSITLDPVAGDWIDVPITSDTDNVPEATQFVVSGANNGRYTTSGDPNQATMTGRDAKAYRQYWLFNDGATVHVTFKIMAPEGGTWSIEKAGNDAAKFKVTIPTETGTTEDLTGSIAAKATSGQPAQTTVISLTITPSSSATAGEEAVLYLKTYVTDKNGIKYSIDSETQLYDIRGYHYFVLNNQNTVQ